MFQLRPSGLCSFTLWIVLSGGLPADQPGIAGDTADQKVVNQDLVTTFTGKLKTVQQGMLIITRDDGVDVMVQPPQDASKAAFVATAKPEFLRPGMLVRFAGTFSQAGVAQSPIAKVELFQPIPGKVAGNLRHKYLPGVYPDKRAAIPEAESGIAKCDVVGSLVGIDATGLMMVQAGKVPVQIALVPNASFEIRYNNLSLAQPGDPVSVSGFYNPPDETKVVADSITITTDRVYGEAVAGQTGRQRPKRRTRRRSGEGETEPSEDQLAKQTEADLESAKQPPVTAAKTDERR